MRVALLGEDNTHDAVLRGLLRRWCSGADPVSGEFRGKTGKSRRRELLSEMERLRRCVGGCDCAAILVDADNHGWHKAMEGERGRVPVAYRDTTVVGAPDRNIECWLSANPTDLASQTECDTDAIVQARRDDPKGVVQAVFKQCADERGVGLYDLMSVFVAKAPLAKWLEDASFKSFYERCQELAQAFDCSLPNEMDCKERLP